MNETRIPNFVKCFTGGATPTDAEASRAQRGRRNRRDTSSGPLQALVPNRGSEDAEFALHAQPESAGAVQQLKLGAEAEGALAGKLDAEFAAVDVGGTDPRAALGRFKKLRDGLDAKVASELSTRRQKLEQATASASAEVEALQAPIEQLKAMAARIDAVLARIPESSAVALRRPVGASPSGDELMGMAEVRVDHAEAHLENLEAGGTSGEGSGGAGGVLPAPDEQAFWAGMAADLKGLRDEIGRSIEHVEAAELRVTQARESFERLDGRVAAAKEAFGTHLPTLEAQCDAVSEFLQSSATVTAARAKAADAQLRTARLSVMQEQYAQQQVKVTELSKQVELAEKVGPGGKLALELEEKLVAVGAAEAALRAAREAPAHRPAPRRGGILAGIFGFNASASRHDLAVTDAEAAVASARKAVIEQRQAIADALAGLKGGLAIEQQKLNRMGESIRTVGASLEGALPAAEIDRAFSEAAHAESAPEVGRLALRARAAGLAINHSLEALGAELLSGQPAPQARDAGHSPGAWERLGRAFNNRLQNTKHSELIGTVTHGAGGFSPATFRPEDAPTYEPTSSLMSDATLARLDRKAEASAMRATAAVLGSGDVPGRAAHNRTAGAMASPVKFTEEVVKLFGGKPASEASSLSGLAPSVLANRLLAHPVVDELARPPGHPLRHEHAMSIAAALRSVTSDPAVAADIYNHLWNNPPALAGVEQRRPGTPSPLASLAKTPPAEGTSASAADPTIEGLADAARRALAGTPNGLEALMSLQGLKRPPPGSEGHEQASVALENLRLSLRAEEALIHTLGLDPHTTSAGVLEAVRSRPPEEGLLDAGRLATGKPKDGSPAEHPATLASQALLYATANMEEGARGAGGVPAEQHPEFKPAYVALRNGFTTSGPGSDFMAMTQRLHKVTTYIERAVKVTPETTFAGVLGTISDKLNQMAGRNKSPFRELVAYGTMGSDLGHVPQEYRKHLGQTLEEAASQMRNALVQHTQNLGPSKRKEVYLQIAALEEWSARLSEAKDPLAKIVLDPARVAERAGAIASDVARNLPRRTFQEVVGVQFDAEQAAAALGMAHGQAVGPGLLEKWLVKEPKVRFQEQVQEKFQETTAMLTGQGEFVTSLADRQERFAKGTPAERRQVVRELMIDIATGGDVSDYADGGRFRIGPRLGVGPGFVVPPEGFTLGVMPMVEASYERERTAVLKAGVASNTGMIYFGSQTRHSAAVGLGARVGMEFGYFGRARTAVNAGTGGSLSHQEGATIRTNRLGTEHETLPAEVTETLKSSNWKRMSELATHALFDLAEPGPQKANNAHKMWTGLVDRLGDYRDISFGASRANDRVWNYSVQGDIQLGAQLRQDPAHTQLDMHKAQVGLFAGAGLEFKGNIFKQSEFNDSAGALTSNTAATSDKNSVVGKALFEFLVPRFNVGDRDEKTNTVGVLAPSRVMHETEFKISGANGSVRLTRRNGKLEPDVCIRQREFALASDYARFINARRGDWAPHLGATGVDGKAVDGGQVLDDFLHQVTNLPPGGNRTFHERKTLRQEAADQIDAQVTQLELLQRTVEAEGGATNPANKGVQEEIEALQARIAETIADDANWKPFKMYVQEENAKGGEQGAMTLAPSSWEGLTRSEVRDTPERSDTSRQFKEQVQVQVGLDVGTHVERAYADRHLVGIEANKPVA